MNFRLFLQANWRGYVVRRKISEWMKKKQKFVEEKERKQTLRIEELLAGLGITYEEAVRAAGVIQVSLRPTYHRVVPPRTRLLRYIFSITS